MGAGNPLSQPSFCDTEVQTPSWPFCNINQLHASTFFSDQTSSSPQSSHYNVLLMSNGPLRERYGADISGLEMLNKRGLLDKEGNAQKGKQYILELSHNLARQQQLQREKHREMQERHDRQKPKVTKL